MGYQEIIKEIEKRVQSSKLLTECVCRNDETKINLTIIELRSKIFEQEHAISKQRAEIARLNLREVKSYEQRL